MQILVTTMSGKEFWVDPTSIEEDKLVVDDDGMYMQQVGTDNYVSLSPYGVESIRIFKNDDRLSGTLWAMITEEEFETAVGLGV
jgi:hypothetical protein